MVQIVIDRPTVLSGSRFTVGGRPPAFYDINYIDTSTLTNMRYMNQVDGNLIGSLNGIFKAYDDDNRLYGTVNVSNTIDKFTTTSENLQSMASDGNTAITDGITDLQVSGGLFIGNSGTSVWGLQTSVFYQTTLSTAYDLTTEGTVNSTTIVNNPKALFVKPDGTKLYYITAGAIYQETISTAWDLTSITFAEDAKTHSGGSSMIGLWFKSDGTKMYTIKLDGSAIKITEWTLSTPWDTKTIGTPTDTTLPSVFGTNMSGQTIFNFYFNSSGTKIGFYLDDDVFKQTLFQIDLGTAWDLSTMSYDTDRRFFLDDTTTSNNQSTFTDLNFSSNGTKMYVLDTQNDRVKQYPLSTAWDVTTAGAASIYSVATQSNDPWALAFKTDGTKMYVGDLVDGAIYQYSLSTAWDVTTATYDSKSLSIAAQETQMLTMAFSDDGTVIWVTGQNTDELEEFTLSTAWDVSTGTFNQQGADANYGNPTYLSVSSDGSSFVIAGGLSTSNSHDIEQYSVSTPWDVSTVSTTPTATITDFFEGLQNTTRGGARWGDNGSKYYVITRGDCVYQFDVLL